VTRHRLLRRRAIFLDSRLRGNDRGRAGTGACPYGCQVGDPTPTNGERGAGFFLPMVWGCPPNPLLPSPKNGGQRRLIYRLREAMAAGFALLYPPYMAGPFPGGFETHLYGCDQGACRGASPLCVSSYPPRLEVRG
jgi:hypothetical protein